MSAAKPSSQQSVLDMLRQRRGADGEPFISHAAHASGARLAVDLLKAGMLPRVTMDWSRGAPIDGGGVGLNPSEAALAARQRADAALRAVGPEFSGLLIDLCGFGKGLEAIERERGWPVRSAKVVARLALAALARHYGYDDAAIGPPRTRGGSWHAPGPRPRIATRQ